MRVFDDETFSSNDHELDKLQNTIKDLKREIDFLKESIKKIHDNAEITEHKKDNLITDSDFEYCKILVEEGKYEELKSYVGKYPDIAHKNESCLLGLAAKTGRLAIIMYLIENGADIHARDDFAIKQASYQVHVNAVKYLISKGADFTVNNYEIPKQLIIRDAVYYHPCGRASANKKSYMAVIDLFKYDILNESIINTKVYYARNHSHANPLFGGLHNALYTAICDGMYNAAEYYHSHGAILQRYFSEIHEKNPNFTQDLYEKYSVHC